MESDAIRFVAGCDTCQRSFMLKRSTAASQHLEKGGTRKNIAIDHFGPFAINQRGDKRHVLMIIDMFTKYLEAYPVNTTATEDTINVLRNPSIDMDVLTPSSLTMDRHSSVKLCPKPSNPSASLVVALHHIILNRMESWSVSIVHQVSISQMCHQGWILRPVSPPERCPCLQCYSSFVNWLFAILHDVPSSSLVSNGFVSHSFAFHLYWRIRSSWDRCSSSNGTESRWTYHEVWTRSRP